MPDRHAGDAIEQIVGRFLAMEPKPEGVSQAAWEASQRETGRTLMEVLNGFGADPRDYRMPDGLWRSQLLPQGVDIDQAIRDGVW